MARNTSMKFYSMELNTDNGKATIDDNIYVLKFPEKLYNYLESVSKREDEVRNTYIKPLSETIKGLYSDIITTDNVINHNTLHKPWLYSFKEYKLQTLKISIREWLERNIKFEKSGIPEEFMDDLKWEVNPIEIKFDVNTVGTSQPEGMAYSFLLSYISHKLSGKLSVTTEGLDKYRNTASNYHFYNVSISEQGAELIAWRPKCSIKKGKGNKEESTYWTYSIVLSLQTVPFSAKPVINVDIKTVRFCNDDIFTTKNQKLRAYVKLPDNKVKGDANFSFIKGDIYRRKIGDSWCWEWDNGFLTAMDALLVRELIPDANEIAKKPLEYIDPLNKASVGIVYGTHIRKWNNIGTGAAFVDKSQIINQLKESLKNINTSLGDIFGDFIIRDNICPDERKIDKPEDFRFSMLPDILNIEAYYYNTEWLNKVYDSIVKWFSKDYYVESKQNEFIIIHKKSNKCKKLFVEPINLKEWGNERLFEIEKNKECYEGFVKELRSRIRKAPEYIGALFELKYLSDGKSVYKDLIDPKQTLRRIMAEKNRLTQFITPVEELAPDEQVDDNENLEHKFISGFKDLLRQLGLINKNISSFKIHPNNEVLYIGVWFYNNSYQRKFPVLVAIKDNKPFMTFYKEEERDVIWRKYEDGEIELGTNPGGKIERNRKINADNLRGFIIKAIEKIKTITGVNDIVVYTLAQNCRQSLAWFQDKNIGVSEATLTIVKNEMDEKYSTVTSGQKLNDYLIVRLRNGSNAETPTWTVVDKSGCEAPFSRHNGVFQINPKVFYSVQRRPSSFKMSGKETRSTKEDCPFKSYKKQSVLEICIPNSKDTHAADLAVITHYLRNDVGIQFNEATELPLPIHLAKSACEYADAYYEKVEFATNNYEIKCKSALEDEGVSMN